MTTSNITTRNDVKKLTANIESLAREVSVKLDTNATDLLDFANELVRNSLTFVFALGEVVALEQVGASGKTYQAVKVGTQNYHNLRDNRGRFAKKI